MHKTLTALPLLALFASPALFAQETDIANGQELLNQNCYKCHDNDIYSRKDRLVTSRAGVTKQVKRCELALGLKWFDDEVEDTAAYLNQTFYHYK